MTTETEKLVPLPGMINSIRNKLEEIELALSQVQQRLAKLEEILPVYKQNTQSGERQFLDLATPAEEDPKPIDPFGMPTSER